MTPVNKDLISLARKCGAVVETCPEQGCVFLNSDHLAAFAARLDSQDGWISVEERLPGPGVIVLAFFRNRYGKGRVVRAHHAPKHTIEAGHWEDAETDDNEDGSFEPEGWYEDTAVGETLSFISPESDGSITHWQPLPSAPTKGQGRAAVQQYDDSAPPIWETLAVIGKEEIAKAIMNLPCKQPTLLDESPERAYVLGHRDARHAAAELVVAALSAAPAMQTPLVDLLDDVPADARLVIDWPPEQGIGTSFIPVGRLCREAAAALRAASPAPPTGQAEPIATDWRAVLAAERATERYGRHATSIIAAVLDSLEQRFLASGQAEAPVAVARPVGGYWPRFARHAPPSAPAQPLTKEEV